MLKLRRFYKFPRKWRRYGVTPQHNNKADSKGENQHLRGDVKSAAAPAAQRYPPSPVNWRSRAFFRLKPFTKTEKFFGGIGVVLMTGLKGCKAFFLFEGRKGYLQKKTFANAAELRSSLSPFVSMISVFDICLPFSLSLKSVANISQVAT